MKKRFMSWFLIMTMLINIVAMTPFVASANDTLTFEYDNYMVDYKITNSWNNGLNNNVTVSIKNTGAKIIENWMLAFDFMGEATMQSGGTIFETEDGITYVKNIGNNLSGYGDSLNIDPGKSVNFSYSLTNPTGTPDSFILCQERVAVENGAFEVTLNSQYDYGNSFQGEIKIKNLTDKPIECWELMFSSSNFTLQNSWDRTLVDHGDGKYTIKPVAGGIIRVNPYSTLTFGFQANKNAFVSFANLDFNVVGMTEVVFCDSSENWDDFDNADDDYEDYQILAEAEYDTENEEILIYWDSTLLDVNFEVFVSEDNIEWEVLGSFDSSIFNTVYSTNNLEDFVIRYFKVVQTTEEDIITSNICYVIYSPIGTPWTEYTRPYDIERDNELLSGINDNNDKYTVSVEFEGAGIPDMHLLARESVYSNAIENDAILGIVPELLYEESLEIENITIKFEIADEYLDNELNTLSSNSEFNGIKRFNIFKFFEDVNMLLPIETKFDNNTVYTEVNELGTYCIMDMEKWLDELGVESDDLIGTSLITPSVLSLPIISQYTNFSASNAVDTNSICNDIIVNPTLNTFDFNSIQSQVDTISNVLSLSGENTVMSDEAIDIVFILQSAGEFESNYEAQKQMIIEVSNKVFDNYSNAQIYVIGYDRSGAYFLNYADNSNNYFTSREDLYCLENYNYEVYYAESSEVRLNRGAAFDKLVADVKLRGTATSFVFSLRNGSSTVKDGCRDQLKLCEELKIVYSEVAAGVEYEKSEYATNVLAASTASKGICIIYSNNSADILYELISGNINITSYKYFEDKIYFGLNWEHFDMSRFDESLRINGNADSDDDGLTDWEEVNPDFYERLGVNLFDGAVIPIENLPTVWYYLCSKGDYMPFRYVNNNNGGLFLIFNEIHVLPLRSNPFEESSAFDGINDEDKLRILPKHSVQCDCEEYDRISADCAEYGCKEGILERYNLYSENDNWAALDFKSADDYLDFYIDYEHYINRLGTRYLGTNEGSTTMDAFKEYTVDSLFPELLSKISFNNRANAPVTLSFDHGNNNHIIIDIKVFFEGDKLLTSSQNNKNNINPNVRSADLEDSDGNKKYSNPSFNMQKYLNYYDELTDNVIRDIINEYDDVVTADDIKFSHLFMNGIKQRYERNNNTEWIKWPTIELKETNQTAIEWKEYLTDLWESQSSNAYQGNVFDFYPGINVEISVNFIVDTVKSINNITVYFYDESGTSHTSGSSNILLYLGSTGTILSYQALLAHEFGHILRLMDAYASKVSTELNSGNNGFYPLSKNEFVCKGNNISITDGMPFFNGMMKSAGGTVIANDIEMVLFAFSTDSININRQLYTPVWDYYIRNNLQEYQVISEANRESQIYITASNVIDEIHPDYNKEENIVGVEKNIIPNMPYRWDNENKIMIPIGE